MSCIRLRQEQGLNTAEEARRAETLLETSTDTEQAAESARMVIEAIVENLQAKQQLFEKLDRILPTDVPICSNTSGLRITDISSLCQHPERTVTTHFWLPAHLVPLVEVVMGDKTDEQLAVKVRDELKAWKNLRCWCAVIFRDSWRTGYFRLLSGNPLLLWLPAWLRQRT